MAGSSIKLDVPTAEQLLLKQLEKGVKASDSFSLSPNAKYSMVLVRHEPDAVAEEVVAVVSGLSGVEAAYLIGEHETREVPIENGSWQASVNVKVRLVVEPENPIVGD
jgi:hypothetical protein